MLPWKADFRSYRWNVVRNVIKVTTEGKTRLKILYKEKSVQIVVSAVYSNYVFENNYYTNVSWWSQEPSEQMWNNQWKSHPFNKKPKAQAALPLHTKRHVRTNQDQKGEDSLARSLSGLPALSHPPSTPLHCPASAVSGNKNTREDLVKAAAG